MASFLNSKFQICTQSTDQPIVCTLDWAALSNPWASDYVILILMCIVILLVILSYKLCECNVRK